MELRASGHFSAFERLLDQVDAPARTVELVAGQLVRRAGRRAKPAMHARAEDRIGLASLHGREDFGQQMCFHSGSLIRDDEASSRSYNVGYMRPRFNTRCGSNTCFSRVCNSSI